MKGPGLRLDLDVRRHWRCAACGTERHTSGSLTTVVCHFCQDHPPMSLVEPQRPARPPAAPLDLVIDLHPDDVDAPAFVPAHLRDPDDLPAVDDAPAESESESETPSDTAAEAVANGDEQQPPLDESSSLDASPAAPDESPPSKKSRRKKNRRKRKPNKGTAQQNSSETDSHSTAAET